jgi:uncharacterized protein YutE (UPF0331/DUF86 family)
MVEEDKVRRLLGVLLDTLADLRRYRDSVSRETLNSNRDTQHMVLHALYVSVQAAVDLALHFGADFGLAQPATYQAAFRRLSESGTIDDALASRLASWAGFRNVLAHFYSVLDYDRVHAALHEIDDLERFAIVIARWLEDKNEPR